MRWLIAGFLVAHGLLHVLIWGMPTRADAPFEAHRSPLFGDVRVVSTTVAVAAGVALILAGIAFIAGADWWWIAAVAGASLSGTVMVLTFTPWCCSPSPSTQRSSCSPCAPR